MILLEFTFDNSGVHINDLSNESYHYVANHVTQMVDHNIFVVKIRVQDSILFVGSWNKDMQYLYAFSFCPSGKNILVECSKSLPTDVMNK